MVPKDKNGNDSMSLSEMGLDGCIRTHRHNGRLFFSKIDVGMALSGKNSNEAGNIFSMSPVCYL